MSKKTTTIVSCPFRSSFFLRSRLFFSPPCDRRRQTPMRSSSFSIRSHFNTYPIVIPPLFFLIQQDWKHFPQSGSYCEKPSLPARCLHLGIPTAIGACCWLGGTTLGWSSAGRERFSKFCVFPCFLSAVRVDLSGAPVPVVILELAGGIQVWSLPEEFRA